MKYTVADYLFDRIHEAGAAEIFGVPGDFNLGFLDNIIASPKLKWIGNTNELNAGYAADGYAREKGFAAMITTFGVGELSAINATAGSYTEFVPVLHIVGAPSTHIQKQGKMLHHSLGDGNFNHFMNMVKPVSIAQAKLTAENAASEIDRVIRAILKSHKPGYLMLPADIAKAPIYPPSSSLTECIIQTTSQTAITAFRATSKKFLANKKTAILADLLVHRFGTPSLFDSLINACELPYATLSWGKSLLDESSLRWIGTYAGSASNESVRKAIEEAERLIEIGVLYTDNTTAGFTHNIDTKKTLQLGAQSSTVGEETFAPIDLNDAIACLREILSSSTVLAQTFTPPRPHTQKGQDNQPLKQIDLWPIIANEMDENNLLIAEQGTAFFGLAPIGMKKSVTLYAQPLWGSIGYTLPATLGAAIASPKKRAVLAIGDGSALFSIQEVSTMIREKIHPVILLINNDGYTVERAIHGPTQPYNDIPKIHWQAMVLSMGGNQENSLSLVVQTPNELREALNQARKHHNKLVFIEIMMHKDDIPPLLADVTAALSGNTKNMS